MGRGTLSIDLNAIAGNWRALDAMSGQATKTGAVVKADAYGLGAARVAKALADAGVRHFFVAIAEEGAAIRKALGPGPSISVFSGHMAGDAALLSEAALTPMLNSVDQLTRHFEALPNHPFGIQLDTGMNRLGMERAEWAAVAEIALTRRPTLLMSHLACADEPEHPQNAAQLAEFRALTDGTNVPRSLSATGGALLGAEYHFDMIRPGIGLYGGLHHGGTGPVVHLSLPVVQTRRLEPGESAGYGAAFVAKQPTTIATVAAGYADGLLRAMGGRAVLWHEDIACPLAGRVSMDLLTVDVTHLEEVPEALSILCPQQGIDDLADAAGTIGYEILTSLGQRYARKYI